MVHDSNDLTLQLLHTTVVVHEGDSTLHLNRKVITVYVVMLFCFIYHISGGCTTLSNSSYLSALNSYPKTGHDTSFLNLFLPSFFLVCFCASFVLLSILALSTPNTALQCSVSCVVVLSPQSMYLGGRFGTDTGCVLDADG